ncbi:MAG: sulfite exporter TauE/SafE family protein [Gammaproteobacteria bacterium]|nr:sulfite exporter TauE/SafE family protein [Gammaproteobacteria bacterium]
MAELELLAIALTAMLASALTLLSGFGLGTLLMPVVALFFPVEVAVAVTALVHLANNAYKFVVLGAGADWSLVRRFGIPAVLLAFPGAWLLTHAAAVPTRQLIGALILLFVLLELLPVVKRLKFPAHWMPLGGALSGFFGGLSGHQGAFRSLFLLKSHISKEQFIATNIVIALLVDVARLGVYGWRAPTLQIDWLLAAIATLAAFAGVNIGRRFIHKVTIDSIQKLVAVLLSVIGVGMMCGIL